MLISINTADSVSVVEHSIVFSCIFTLPTHTHPGMAPCHDGGIDLLVQIPTERLEVSVCPPEWASKLLCPPNYIYLSLLATHLSVSPAERHCAFQSHITLTDDNRSLCVCISKPAEMHWDSFLTEDSDNRSLAYYSLDCKWTCTSVFLESFRYYFMF